jgi:L-asparagine permease
VIRSGGVLVGVLVLMALDYPVGTFPTASLVVIVPALVGGWFAVRARVESGGAERMGNTGEFPVKANRPPAE